METIGKYQVGRLLGRGGMGTVYEATDPVIHRKVALKTMIPGLAETGDLKARFLREAQAAGGLRHRNIVTVYDLGEDRGQPYIAMEFIEGTDLERIIQNKEPLSIEWKLDVVRQVCEGLSYAHRNGIVHRDIKPANIRVTPEGEVKIMDFGIAHLQSSTMTKSGLVLGTVHYMAPEQVEGQKVDHRADIFSVGAIAYELVAYKKPFDGDSLTAVMFKIMRDRPDPAALPHTEYSPGLETIIMKALAREIGERYQSLEDMHDDLERLVRDTAPRLLTTATQIQAPKPPIGEHEKESVSRARALADEARRSLAAGETERALECARQSLALAPADTGARKVLQEAETEALRRRVEREMSDMRAEMQRARSEGQLQKALGLCKRLLELEPDDAGLRGTAREIEESIQEREVEQLSGMALGYAADGDMELAHKIAGKIARIAPQSKRYLELKSYLDEESARTEAEALTATAREHLALGNLDEARAAAEEALGIYPAHPVAREIRDRAASILATREKASRNAEVVRPETLRPPAALPDEAPEEAAFAAEDVPPPTVVIHAVGEEPVPDESPAPADEDVPTVVVPAFRQSEPVPVLAPVPVVAPAMAPVPVAPRHVQVSAPGAVATMTPPPIAPTPIAVPEPAPAAPAPSPPVSQPTPIPGDPRVQAAALMTSALRHFVENNYPKAKKAAEKALSLDPENKKARELMKILGALG